MAVTVENEDEDEDVEVDCRSPGLAHSVVAVEEEDVGGG